MTAKKWIGVGASILAAVAIVVGLCLFFFGNKDIKIVPTSLKVEQVEKDYVLVAEFNSQFQYQFKLEQQIDEQFVTVDIVNSKVNTINLSKHKIGVEAGQNYRFSVCFTNENGAGAGEFSETLQWQPSWSLDEVSDVSFEENELSWKAVNQADFYTIVLVDDKGVSQSFNSEENFFIFENLQAGRYVAHIFANSNNPFISNSLARQGFGFSVIKKNQIVSAYVNSQDVLTILTTEKVEAFQVFVNEKIKAVLKVNEVNKNGEWFSYSFKNFNLLLSGETSSEVQIKSVATEFILESEMLRI